MSEIYKYTVELDDPDFVDPERGGYGAAIVGEVTYKIIDVVEADTPMGPCIRQSVEIIEEEVTMFVSDQDGGQLYETETELADHISDERLVELIERSL